ncbi:Calcium/calmodulin-dependent protein kinase type IV [Acropora cervicornis]|uniref:Calcium/calmodulin-dependent protein kinase type IV n=1 Tax=Acropora cervicornis TaxID=6130 RepID=A0AAD9Q1Q7_ACRCE|nr:Calcium/calmodulin-dependent protein kinase type IV [Acropora cervicornis]
MAKNLFSYSRKGDINESYVILAKALGRGASSVVKVAEHKGTKKKYAVKMITKTVDQKIISTEIGILLQLNHPNIIKLYEIFETPSQINMILELVNGGELFERIVERGYYSERDAADALRQILSALKKVHGNDPVIIHRDLKMHDSFLRTQAVHTKPNRCVPVDNGDDGNSYDDDKVVSDVSFLFAFKPENLLYNLDENGKEVLKIADFGLSKMLYGEENTSTVCGTPGYCVARNQMLVASGNWAPLEHDLALSLAPEVLRGEKYDTKIDMWAVGVIAYILLCGFEPFYDERGDQAMFRRILNCDYEFVAPWWDDVSENAKDLVRKLIVLDPKKRLTAKEALEHEWIKGKIAKRDKLDPSYIEQLKDFNAKRKFKGGAIAVQAATSALSAALNKAREKK